MGHAGVWLCSLLSLKVSGVEALAEVAQVGFGGGFRAAGCQPRPCAGLPGTAPHAGKAGPGLEAGALTCVVSPRPGKWGTAVPTAPRCPHSREGRAAQRHGTCTLGGLHTGLWGRSAVLCRLPHGGRGEERGAARRGSSGRFSGARVTSEGADRTEGEATGAGESPRPPGWPLAPGSMLLAPTESLTCSASSPGRLEPWASPGQGTRCLDAASVPGTPWSGGSSQPSAGRGPRKLVLCLLPRSPS